MLWTAAWAVYLGVSRWLGLPMVLTLGLGVYLAGLAVLRMRWGYDQGSTIAGLFTGLAFMCLGAVPALSVAWHGSAFGFILLAMTFLWLFGTVLGFAAFSLVGGLLKTMDRLDDLLATKIRRSE